MSYGSYGRYGSGSGLYSSGLGSNCYTSGLSSSLGSSRSYGPPVFGPIGSSLAGSLLPGSQIPAALLPSTPPPFPGSPKLTMHSSLLGSKPSYSSSSYVSHPGLIGGGLSISDRYRSKYGTDSTDSARQSTRLQSEKPVTRSESAGSVSTEKDYKKLYEEQFLEIEKLKEKLKKSEQILEETKTQLERVLATRGSARESLTDADRREKRALERKLSEMEEELKQLEVLKADNQRLKDENGALIRVISKLSK